MQHEIEIAYVGIGVPSPAGFQVEVGHGTRVITDNWDGNRRYDRISAWGHQPLGPQAPTATRRP